ncbi:MAG: crotonase/enoyl-CoA hydratase family protein [Mycobacteriaceae bacterium]
MTGNITLQVADDIAYVTLNREEKLNSLTLDMLGSLKRTARIIAANKSVRAVILSGAGETFSSGLDFRSTTKTPGKVVRYFISKFWRGTNGFQEACWAWRRVPVPVIAVITGHCYGGALQLALAADIRYTTAETKFSIMESKWGLIPDMSGTATLSELIGIDKAKILAMTGEEFDGIYAESLGLVTAVCSDPMDSAHQLIAKLQHRSPDAVAATKTLFNKTWGKTPRRSFAIERRTQFTLLRGKNSAISRKAALNKELPRFLPRTFQ